MDLLTYFQPFLLEALSLVLTTVISLAALKIKEKTGLDIDARHREALHSAIMSAVKVSVLTNQSPINKEAVIAYVKQSVPDAVSKLKASDDVLVQLAESKIRDVMGGMGAQGSY